MVRKFIVSQAKLSLYFRGGWPVLFLFFYFLLIQWGNPQETTNRNAKVLSCSLIHGLPPQLSLAVRITVRKALFVLQVTIAVVEDWVQGYRSCTRKAASADLHMQNW